MKMNKFLVAIVSTLFLCTSCDDNTTPRPVGYMRIDLPSTEYEALDIDCPFSFDINTESNWEKNEDGDCWGNVVYPSIKAQVQFTYKHIDGDLDKLLQEAHGLAYKHTVRADGIQERLFSNNETDVHGLLFRMRGEAATTTQFFLTDSTEHFLRGVVYFYASPNADSLRPVDNFMAREVTRMIETTQWSTK